MPATYEPIATTTLGSATSSVTFSGISGTYTDIKVVINAAVTSSADNVCFRYNGDTGSNYSRTGLAGTGTSALSARSLNATFNEIDYYGYLETVPSFIAADIMNYSNSTTYKTVLGRSSNAGNGTGATAGLWRNTNAITSITIFTKGGINFAIGSVFTLYGIKAA
jgi:hypothetical protein